MWIHTAPSGWQASTAVWICTATVWIHTALFGWQANTAVWIYTATVWIHTAQLAGRTKHCSLNPHCYSLNTAVWIHTAQLAGRTKHCSLNPHCPCSLNSHCPFGWSPLTIYTFAIPTYNSIKTYTPTNQQPESTYVQYTNHTVPNISSFIFYDETLDFWVSSVQNRNIRGLWKKNWESMVAE